MFSGAEVVWSVKEGLAFVRGLLLVVVSNQGAEALGFTGCVEVDTLPDAWAGVCAGGRGEPARVKLALGKTIVSHCEESSIAHSKWLFCWQHGGAGPFALAPA